MRRAWPFIILILLTVLIVVIQIYSPKSMNWNRTFEKKDKNPYGSYLVFRFMSDLFPGKKIEVTDRTSYEVLEYYNYENDQEENYEDEPVIVDSFNYDSQTPDTSVSYESPEEFKNTDIIPDNPLAGSSEELKNYIVITDAFSPGESDALALMNYAAKGNSIFIATQNMYGYLADTLKLKQAIGLYEGEMDAADFSAPAKGDSLYLEFINRQLSAYGKHYWYLSGSVTGYFSSFDTLNTTVLGLNSNKQANFIRVKYGQGEFLISSVPLAFTNYNMVLGSNAEYVATCLSHLPLRNTYWDEYYKPFHQQDQNPLRFIQSQAPLNWAFNISVWAALLYIFFEAKRRQRIIPVVEPPKNTTVEFVSTIGQLYFQKGNHKDIAEKKISYFLEYIRSHYYLDTSETDDEFMKKLSERTGVDHDKIKQLFNLIRRLQQDPLVSQEELIELNKRIDEIKKRH